MSVRNRFFAAAQEWTDGHGSCLYDDAALRAVAELVEHWHGAITFGGCTTRDLDSFVTDIDEVIACLDDFKRVLTAALKRTPLEKLAECAE